MSITTLRNEILGLFLNSWNSNVVSQNIKVLYDDTINQKPKNTQPVEPWVRVIVRHTGGGQSALYNFNGVSRYRRNGFFIAQIFTPYGDGLTLSDALVNVILSAFEGKATSSGAWFRQSRVNEVGQDGVWYQTNVLTNFEYDEVK